MDYPNSKKAKKVFLCLFVGSGNSSSAQLPKGLEGDEEAGDTVAFERRRERDQKRRSGKRKNVKVIDKEWILKKKEVSFMSLCSL